MTDSDEFQRREKALAGRLRLLWEQAHGAPAGKAHVLIGTDSVAAMDYFLLSEPPAPLPVPGAESLGNED